MKGIIIKDNFESFLIKKNFFSWLFSTITIIILVLLMRNIYAYVLMVGVMLPMIGTSTLQYSMEQDEISKFDQILLTYPVTKKEIIQAKYISGLILILINNLILSSVIMCLFVYGYNALDLTMGLYALFSGFIFAIIMTAINYVGFFWLGNKKGTIVFVIMVLAYAIIYVLLEMNFSIKSIISLGTVNLLAIGMIVAVIMMICSYFISVKIYTKKHS